MALVGAGTHVVVYTDVHILAFFLLLLDKASRQTAAPGIDDVAALFPLDGRMQAKVLATCEAQASEFLLVPEAFGPKLHEGLELDESLFNLGHCT
jgi:hypothetical protein